MSWTKDANGLKGCDEFAPPPARVRGGVPDPRRPQPASRARAPGSVVRGFLPHQDPSPPSGTRSSSAGRAKALRRALTSCYGLKSVPKRGRCTICNLFVDIFSPERIESRARGLRLRSPKENPRSRPGVLVWPQRDSDPCLHLERVASLAARRWGRLGRLDSNQDYLNQNQARCRVTLRPKGARP